MRYEGAKRFKTSKKGYNHKAVLHFLTAQACGQLWATTFASSYRGFTGLRPGLFIFFDENSVLLSPPQKNLPIGC